LYYCIETTDNTLLKDSKIYVAGHNGMVGSAIVRRLLNQGYSNIITRSSRELDLRNQLAVNTFFEVHNPEYVFLAAATVGGINANNVFRGEFIYDNLMIQSNVIHAAKVNGVKKLLFLGSSCIYPKESIQPIKEDYLLSGKLEATNEPYAIAKIAGLKMCQAYRQQYGFDFISVMPTNIYGINDNYDSKSSHVLPALIARIHQSKVNGSESVTIWGTGRPKREFLYADDLAEACLFLMQNYSESEPINVGTGEDISINDLAELVAEIVGFDGFIYNDISKLDGTNRKLLDVSKIRKLGWRHTTELKDGIKLAYADYLYRNK
jgi:GDP-L-fucose synthase